MVYMNLIRQILIRPALAGLLFLVFTVGAYAQNWGSLGKIAILPFSDGTTDEQEDIADPLSGREGREGLAEMLGFTPEMTKNFEKIPRTTITQAVKMEQSFQNLSGMTDPETSAKLGEQLGADYVMAGSITALGSQKLLIVSIIKIDVIRQVAGAYITYDSEDDFNRDDTLLENMAAELVNMTRTAGDSDGLMLALLPVEFTGGVNKEEGDALAQLLAIYLLRGGKYTIYPRTKNLEQVQDEYETQGKSGVTRPDEAVRPGEGVNPPYVLSISSRKIGTVPRFIASIIELKLGSVFQVAIEEYTSMSDGMWAMAFLAKKLSGEEITEAEREARALPARLAQEAQEAEAARKAQEAELARKAQEAARKAQERDALLRDLSIVLGGRVGGGTGFSRNKVNEEGEVVKDGKGSILLGADVEFRWRFLGIQSGILINTAYVPLPDRDDQYAELRLIQIPVLFCFNPMLRLPDDVGLGITSFIGFGVNVAASSLDADSVDDRMSFIAGAGFVLVFGSVEVSIGYQFDGGKGSLILDDVSYDYSRQSHGAFVGVKFYLPFKK
jgi:TolB-like protein